MNKLPYGARYSRDEKGELHVDPEEWIDMSKTYHTDLDRDDFEPGELLPWQDMSRHLQALEHQLNTVQAMASGQNKAIESIEKHMGHVDWLNYDLGEQFKLMNGLVEKVATLEKALQTTTDSLRQAHLLIKNLQTHTIRAEEKIEELEDDSLETITGPCVACDRLGLIDGNGMCQGCVLEAIMEQQSHA